MKAVILSNDNGNPWFPAIYQYSKSMLPILNRPSLEYLIEFLGMNKFHEIFIISNSESDGFSQYFGGGEKNGVVIRYIKDRRHEGTAGCLRNVASYLKDESCFLLANAGMIPDFDLQDFIRFHKLRRAVATVGFIKKNETPWPLEGLNIADGNQLQCFHRAHHSHDRRKYCYPCGIYLFDSRILSYLNEEGYLDIKEQLIPHVQESTRQVYVREINGYFSCIHNLEDYYQVNRELLCERFHSRPAQDLIKIADDVWCWPTADISLHSTLIGPLIVGDHCQIEDDCVLIGPTVIGNNCTISKSSLIRESIVWNNCSVPEEAKIETCIIMNSDSLKKGEPLKNRAIGAADQITRLGPCPKPVHFNGAFAAHPLSLTEIKTRAYDISKRIFDLLFSSLCLILLAPAFVIIPLLIKLDSAGPVLFRQKRCGKDGIEFTMYKFRSMVANAEAIKEDIMAHNRIDGPMFKIKNDPRLTKVGSLLRKFSLDEVPQLVNVFKGDMSLVGPRPLEKKEMKFNPVWRDVRLTIKPGITGQWQINSRHECSFNSWITQDIDYVHNRSFWRDLKILWTTIQVVFSPGEVT